ncbi:DUF2938 domain-containing protein [Neorhizobium galegae]|uniref:PF11158 family protein n=1 Tax=Neorhizobium galegae bv. orientalis str. HAMBI 540 TaxID=1028800 RepID=A0A068SU64_NEOGA|nr:DUF2938 domain-containing protein [Neorhizobium galegae]CDN48630.1 PF11158 family protein [Neorhizobium galegae bv. orientalis str. HAMBI 540]
MIELLWRGILIGLGATILMDLWAIVLNRVFGQPKANWAPAGRWFWHLQRGKVFHDSIAAAEPYRHELPLGWAGHYAIGILYGVILALIIGQSWFAAPSFIPAWIFGIVTIGAGWFLMQPGLGLGWAASKTPRPNKVRFLNFAAHTVFALGLYGTALLIR